MLAGFRWLGECPMRFRCEVNLPVKRINRVESVDVFVDGSLPFVPHAGVWVTAGPHHDLRQVESVYFCHGSGFEVWLKPNVADTLEDMQRAGWKEEEL